MINIIFYILAFLAGSIPNGYIVTKRQGVDITKLGSGNIGATNVFRNLGWKTGLLVFILDMAKGAIPLILFYNLVPEATKLDLVLAGGLAILGHIFTPWLKLNGGKGVATSAGVLLVLMPIELAIAFGVWFILVLITKYVSLGSIMAAITVAASHLLITTTQPFSEPELPVTILAIACCLIVVYAHKKNIKKLLTGEEKKIKSNN